MAISDAIQSFLAETGMSHRELAEKLHFDRSFITKVKNGERKWPEAHDAKLARLSWKLALHLADERTGGFISNVLRLIPNMDLHPSAMKETLLRELHEAIDHLEELRMARHHDREKLREQAETVWLEIKDVIDKGLIMLGVIEEEFELDRERLIQRHKMRVKENEQ